ncbi:MAG: replication-associated recombination protein A [Betaproteobacteria bacterium]|nr:replication-associated recombination protein A [Betaproteobacteria bacterium]
MSGDLFDQPGTPPPAAATAEATRAAERAHAPLAELMRPASLDEVVGQRHLLGDGRPLRLAVESGTPHSMILWGPPGVGKTTIARLLARAFDAEFIALSAVFSGVKDIREAVGRAREILAASGRRTILFVDEVHRFNKAQQDAFLPFVEQGLLTFIGATTENPSFEVNSALLSRATVYVLTPLSEDDLAVVFERARSQVFADANFDDDARARLIGFADGDARRLLNLLEQIHTAADVAGVTAVSAEFLDQALSRKLRRFDKGGEAFYDQISALHKAVRGSSPDAALYWFVRMLDGGADPLYVGRRLIRMATEDVGLADPRALTLALEAVQAYERLGSPEGELALAQAVIYMACAAKSNAVYVAWQEARRFVAEDGSSPVPLHLRNAPTRLMKDLGYGRDYRYAQDEPEGYAAGERYFPDDMPAVSWYRPTDRGLEARIAEKLEHLRSLDRKARGG